MDIVCKFIGTSTARFKTGDIVEVAQGADENRRLDHTDEQWQALKTSRLAMIKENALGFHKLKENDFEISWEGSSGTHQSDMMAQAIAYNKSLDTYADQRKKEYPPIEDQLDKIYHEGIDAWKADMIKPVKDKYPKE